MKTWFARCLEFLAEEDGPTAIEYAVMVALIIIVALVAVTAFGNKLKATFEGIVGQMP